MCTEKDKMLAGEPYDASALEIKADLAATRRWLARYNATIAMPAADRRAPSPKSPSSGRRSIA